MKYQIEEIQPAEVQKNKWQDNRNTSDFWVICDFWIMSDFWIMEEF